MRGFNLLLSCVLVSLCLCGSAWAVLATDYGVVCNGSTDTTVALQNAINASRSGTAGKVLQMPDGGTCMLSNTITVTGVVGFALVGNGVEFQPVGSTMAAKSMFLYVDAQYGKLSNFKIHSSPSQPLNIAIESTHGVGGLMVPTALTVEDVVINGTNTGGLQKGVAFTIGPGGDNNNEHHRLINVSVNSATVECFYIAGTQSKQNVFEDCGCSGNNVTVTGIHNVSGSFTAIRFKGGNVTGVVFQIDYCADFYEIQDLNFEGGARLLSTGGPSGASCPVYIRGGRWGIPELHADNKAIIYQFKGVFYMQGLYFDGPSNNKALIFQLQIGAGGSAVFIGNQFSTTVLTPYTGNIPLGTVLSVGNIINRNDGQFWVRLP